MAHKRTDGRHDGRHTDSRNAPETTETPISRFTDLNELTVAGSDLDFTAGEDELTALTEWAGVRKVISFSGKVFLKRLSTTRFAIRASFDARIEQTCVVSLEPVTSRLKGELTRELFFCEEVDSEGGELTLSSGDDDAPDTVTSYKYDVCLPLLEEFSLSIDPYPRREGALFAEKSADKEPRENPFAALQSLKESMKP